MENEELFAGEAALDAQQQLVRNSRHTTETSLQVHDEPLLADDSDEEWTQTVQHDRDIDTRPSWRKASVSVRLKNKVAIRPNMSLLDRFGGYFHLV